MIEIQAMLENSKDELAKTYINEAIQCYNIGAYRACINSTWQAVYTNIVYKIKELSLQDNNAKKFINNLEKAIENKDISKLLDIEKSILDIKNKGISIIDEEVLKDFKRLKDDRNRCSHPNINIDDEIYIPSKYLARYHLYNAVEKFISQENIYGKNFYLKVIDKITSTNFPENYGDCVIVLKNHYLSKPNNSLIRKLLEEIIGNIIKDGFDRKVLLAYLNTLKYLLTLNDDFSKKTIIQYINKRISEDNINIKNIHYVLSLDDTLFSRLNESSKITIKTYLENELDIESINYYSTIIELNETIGEILKNLSSEKELSQLSLRKSTPEIKNIIIDKYIHSGNFYFANSLANTISEILLSLSENEISKFLIKAYKNSQITSSHEFQRTLLPNLKDKFSDKELRELEKQAQEELR